MGIEVQEMRESLSVRAFPQSAVMLPKSGTSACGSRCGCQFGLRGAHFGVREPKSRTNFGPTCLHHAPPHNWWYCRAIIARHLDRRNPPNYAQRRTQGDTPRRSHRQPRDLSRRYNRQALIVTASLAQNHPTKAGA